MRIDSLWPSFAFCRADSRDGVACHSDRLEVYSTSADPFDVAFLQSAVNAALNADCDRALFPLLSERTAVLHVNNAMHKLGCVNKHQAVLKALRLGLIH